MLKRDEVKTFSEGEIVSTYYLGQTVRLGLCSIVRWKEHVKSAQMALSSLWVFKEYICA